MPSINNYALVTDVLTGDCAIEGSGFENYYNYLEISPEKHSMKSFAYFAIIFALMAVSAYSEVTCGFYYFCSS